jgi:integrase/recombinase XerD
MEELKTYLQNKYRNRTVTAYLQRIAKYLQNQQTPEKSLYRDVFTYISNLRKSKGYHVTNNALSAIKSYYYFLQETGKRSDHPCKNLKLKDKVNKHIQLQDLFSEKELESMLNHESLKEGYLTQYSYQLRNKCILQLLIYQGLQTGEIVRLKVSDVNLEKGSIYIASSAVTNSRELKLKSEQIMSLYKYKTEDREVLLQNIKKPLNQLFLTNQSNISNQTVCIILSKMQEDFKPRILNPVKVRQSVITLKLKQGTDLRIVQAFSGHKNTSSLQRYQQNNIEQLKDSINKYHPLQ